MKKLFGFAIALSGALCLLTGQDATIKVSKEAGIPAIAIPAEWSWMRSSSKRWPNGREDYCDSWQTPISSKASSYHR